MDMEIVKPAAVVGVVAAAAIVMLAVSFVRLAKFKGFRESFPWLLFAPMPITKAMYMLILAVIAANSERPFPGAWLWGAALAFAVVIGLQWVIASRRIDRERIVDSSVEATCEVPWWVRYARGSLPFKVFLPIFKVFLPIMLCAVIETVAVFALVAALIFGQRGMNTAARVAGRTAGSLAASFFTGVAEGVRDTVSTKETTNVSGRVEGRRTEAN